jgi:hypothetical protein
MKLLLENWKKFLNEQKMYHSTLQPRNAESIETNGLRVGSEEVGFSLGSNWANDVYGVRPVYLSMKPSEGGGRRYEGITFVVDISGLTVYPDLPTLVDYGAYVDESGMYWEYGEVPPEMEGVVDGDGSVSFDELLTPNSPAANAAIELTDTAVSLENIGPEKLRKIKK